MVDNDPMTYRSLADIRDRFELRNSDWSWERAGMHGCNHCAAEEDIDFGIGHEADCPVKAAWDEAKADMEYLLRLAENEANR